MNWSAEYLLGIYCNLQNLMAFVEGPNVELGGDGRSTCLHVREYTDWVAELVVSQQSCMTLGLSSRLGELQARTRRIVGALQN